MKQKWHFYLMWGLAEIVNLGGGIILIVFRDYGGIAWIGMSVVWFFVFNYLRKN